MVADGPTPSQTIGPFFGFALPFAGDSRAVDSEAAGALRVEGQVLDGAGQPVPDALVEIWRAGQFARCRTDPEGAYHVVVVKPSTSEPAGGPRQAPFLNVTVFARGLMRQLVTRLYFPDEETNAVDPVLAMVDDPSARSTLIARRDGAVLRFDIHLQGERETVFFAF